MAEQTQILPHRLHTTFISLQNPNFCTYLAAQIGSNIGNWIQITAENWLVLQLTDSGLALGITNALQFGPLVFFGLYGGVIADRYDRRRLLIVTQSALALLAAAIGLLVITSLIQLWMIWLAALLLGLIMSIDKPALLAFVKDLVGEAGRMIGPAIGLARDRLGWQSCTVLAARAVPPLVKQLPSRGWTTWRSRRPA
jgi:MFS family permease